MSKNGKKIICRSDSEDSDNEIINNDDSEEISDNDSEKDIGGDNSEEKWKAIDEHNDWFVSNHGRLKCDVSNIAPHIPSYLRSGYRSKSIRSKWLKIHRLVALAFVTNDDPKKNKVDHLDGNKLNNRSDNLEWVTQGENTRRGFITGKNRVTKRAIHQFTLDGEFIAEHESMSIAAEATDTDCGAIAKCCKGERNKAGGFTWKFAVVNPDEFDKKTFDWTGYKPIEGFPLHFVNKEGSVVSKKFGKYMKQQLTADGYKAVTLLYKKNKASPLVHQLVVKAFAKNYDPNTNITHKDKNKVNNNFSNLNYGIIKKSKTHQTPKLSLKDDNGSGEKSEVLVSKIESSDKVIKTAKRAVKKVDNTVIRVRRA